MAIDVIRAACSGPAPRSFDPSFPCDHEVKPKSLRVLAFALLPAADASSHLPTSLTTFPTSRPSGKPVSSLQSSRAPTGNSLGGMEPSSSHDPRRLCLTPSCGSSIQGCIRALGTELEACQNPAEGVTQGGIRQLEALVWEGCPDMPLQLSWVTKRPPRRAGSPLERGAVFSAGVK